jgi:hypothetical protein
MVQGYIHQRQTLGRVQNARRAAHV